MKKAPPKKSKKLHKNATYDNSKEDIALKHVKTKYKKTHPINLAFNIFSKKTSDLVGSAWSFIVALALVIIWGLTGHLFHYSDTWQLVINTGTTIVTFLVVFLIQNTQNRDTIALQLKLDELILATRGARNDLACIEDGSERDMDAARAQVHARAERV